MIADDDDDIRFLLETAARRAGFEIAGSYGDGVSALRAAVELSPELLLLDVSMPGLSGLEVLARVRAQEGDVRAHAIIVSANAAVVALEAGEAAGADGYLTKPFSLARLVAMLREVRS
ncbi:response regulator [Pseudoclavibacter sp. RFBB5]|nr:response regulator [Pseudoclavibacter sp. RFBB5]